MLECPHCKKTKLVWQADFDFSDYGYEGEGIVSEYICSNCNARVKIEVPLEEDE